MKINLFILLLVLVSFTAYSQDCNSLRKNGESYGAGDNAISWCDFETQTAYVKCMCDRESNYQNQITEGKRIGEKYNSDVANLRKQEDNAVASGNYRLAIDYLNQHINLVKQNPINDPQWAVDRKLITLRAQRKQYESSLNDNSNSQNDGDKEITITNNSNSSSTNKNTSSYYSSPNQVTQEQTTTNAINSFSNIIGSIAQNANESADKNARIEAQRQAEREAIIKQRRIDFKDGKGIFDGQNKKIGVWTYYYMNTTAPKSSGSYKNGKKEGIWEYYNNQEYNQEMIKKIDEIILYENDITINTYKAKFVDYSTQWPLFYKGYYLFDKDQIKSKYGLWETYNEHGVNLSTGYYNLNGKENGYWVYGHKTKSSSHKPAKEYKKQAEIYFDNGLIDGKRTTYYQNGNIEHQQFYIDGLLEGTQKLYHENGQLYSIYNNKKGKIDGESKDYYDNGNLMREELYDNGVKIKIIEYDKSGNVLNHRILTDLNSEEEQHKKHQIALQELRLKEIELYNNAESVQYHNASFEAPKMIKGEIIVKDSDNNDIKVSHYQDEVIKINNPFLFVKIENKIAVINSDKEIVIPPKKFDTIIVQYRWFNEVAVVSKDNKYGAINEEGEIILPLEYDYAGLWSNKTFWVKKNNLLGLINEEGEIILPVEYEYIGRGWVYGVTKKKLNKSKTARIKKNGKWGWINHLGEIVIEPIYDETWSAKLENPTKVRLKNEIFNINKKGERIK